MRILYAAAGLGLGLILLILVPQWGVDATEKPTAQIAEQAAGEWLNDLGATGLKLDAQFDEGGFEIQDIVGSNSVMAVLSQDKWRITIGFSGPIDADTPLKTVQDRLSYVALDRLPTPGLEIEGWDIRPTTPTSSISDQKEIAITGFKDGKLTLHVETKCFALKGRDPDVLTPADAPMPKGSYFQIRRNFSLLLNIEASVGVQ